jgi:acetyl esterase/lipase
MTRLFTLAVVLFLGGCASAQFVAANAPTTFDRIEKHGNLAYGDDPRQKMDIYSPRQRKKEGESKTQGRGDKGGTAASGLRPVVVFWYGGTWVSGSKAKYRFVGTTLAEHGIVAVVADYRLYPQVHFPAFDEDGARAIAWVEQHIQEYGGDPHHIVLMGHSAGGHTAAFLAFNHEFDRKYGVDFKDIRGLVGLSGPYVLTPETDEERATFPPPFTEKDYRPIYFVDSQSPPTLLIHGADDKVVLPREATELRDEMVRQHLPVELHLYPNRGHGVTVASFAPVLKWRTPAVKEVVDFVKKVSQ